MNNTKTTKVKHEDATHWIDLTPASEKLLIDYADDAGNWGGRPLVGGNVGGEPADKGNLTDLKIKGLVETDTDPTDRPDLAWLSFTPLGIKFLKTVRPDEDWSSLDY